MTRGKATHRRVVSIPVLPGQDPDIVSRGGAACCVHLLVRDEASKFVEPHGLHPVAGEDGRPIKQRLEVRPTRFRLACDPKRDYHTRIVRGVTKVTPRTEEPSAVTCPKCRASADYAAVVAERERVMATVGGDAERLAREASDAAVRAVEAAATYNIIDDEVTT